MNPQARKLFFIVVHHGQEADTAAALESLYAGAVVPDGTLVIDHGATPYEAPDPRVRVIRPRTNAGYAGGINLGLGALISLNAKASDIVVCMNNDVVVRPDTVAALARWWEQHPQPALVGVVSHERGTTVYGGGSISLWTGRSRLFTDRRAPHGSVLHPTYIHGACMSAPYALFLRLKGLPEEYFQYWEDAAFSQRVRRLGFPLHVASSVVVFHQPAATLSSSRRTYFLVRGGALFLERETPWGIRHLWWALNRVRLLYHRSRAGEQAKLVARALADAHRGYRLAEAPSEGGTRGPLDSRDGQ